jgi:hypothetical protein
MERQAGTNTVVLIHGLWMTPLSWEHWVARYEQRGLKVITPGYPGIEPGTAGVEALQSGIPDKGLVEPSTLRVACDKAWNEVTVF